MQTAPKDGPKYVVWEQVTLAKGAYRVEKVRELAFLPQGAWSAIDGDQFTDELTMALALLGRAYIGAWIGMESVRGMTVNVGAHLL